MGACRLRMAGVSGDGAESLLVFGDLLYAVLFTFCGCRRFGGVEKRGGAVGALVEAVDGENVLAGRVAGRGVGFAFGFRFAFGLEKRAAG